MRIGQRRGATRAHKVGASGEPLVFIYSRNYKRAAGQGKKGALHHTDGTDGTNGNAGTDGTEERGKRKKKNGVCGLLPCPASRIGRINGIGI